MSTMVMHGIDLAALSAAVDAALAPTPEPKPEPVIARRVKMHEAKEWFAAGGDVVVSEYGDKSTYPVTRSTTVHNSRSTTWEALREQVNEWKGRYPNQRYYIVPAAADAEASGPDHGFTCKKCGEPSPVGVGYVADGPAAGQRSAGLTACPCGNSRTATEEPAPQPTAPVDPDRKQFHIPKAEELPSLSEVVEAAIETAMPGKTKANVAKREAITKAVIAALTSAVTEEPVYEVEAAGARVAIGDPIELGNATVYLDGYGALSSVVFDEGYVTDWAGQ